MIGRATLRAATVTGWLTHLPIWTWCVLLVVGVAVVTEGIVYERSVAAATLSAQKSLLERLGSTRPNSPFKFRVLVSDVNDQAHPATFEPDQALNTAASATVQIRPFEYDGDCTRPSTVATIAIQLHAPAFDVEALDDEHRDVELLRRRYCDVSAKAPTRFAPWSWIVLPKEAGRQAIVLRITALDRHAHEVDSRVIVIPTIVHDPPDLQFFLGIATGLTGLAGSLWGVLEKIRGKAQPAGQWEAAT